MIVVVSSTAWRLFRICVNGQWYRRVDALEK